MALDNSVKKKIFSGGILGICLAIIVVFSSVFISNYFTNPFIPNSTKTGDLFYTIPKSIKTNFGTYIPYETSLDFTPNLPPFSIASDLSNVKNYDPSNPFFQALTEEAKALLVKNGFVVVPSGYHQIYDIYVDNEDESIPNFVTTDAVLHAYHILYDNALRCVEGDNFESMLLSLTELMVDASKTQYSSLISPSVKEAAWKNLAFFSVANYLLDPMVEIDSSVLDLVETELQLVNSHSGIDLSPIFGYLEDYSQYKPRGHYTRTEGLSRFFKAMMWYGRINFRLKPSDGKGMNETRQALLISSAMTQSEEVLDLWHDIYEPTVFFVGSADDLIYSDYWEIIQGLLSEPIDLELFENESLVEKIITRGLEYRNPRIFSSLVFPGENASVVTKGLRFMGQRFIPDSYIFQSLVYDSVKDMRLFPKSLDIFAILGSNRSKELLKTEADLYPDYFVQREKLEQEFSEYNASTWTQNLYWLWLYSLMPLLYPKGSGFPVYMQTPAWVDKELYTALGSWTELRHDTILYGKQSYTSFTAVPPEPDQGYVEPNAILYARLASLALMTFNGLKSRNLMPALIEDRLDLLHDLLLSLMEISQKELEAQALNESEINLIKEIGERLTTIVNLNESKYTTDVDNRMAIVADVHTDPNTNQVLEEGVGNPFLIFVVNQVNGELILSRGGTFSYYEFKYPLANRLTDEEWQNILDIGTNVPDLPEWVSSFIAINSYIPHVQVLASQGILCISRRKVLTRIQ